MLLGKTALGYSVLTHASGGTLSEGKVRHMLGYLSMCSARAGSEQRQHGSWASSIRWRQWCKQGASTHLRRGFVQRRVAVRILRLSVCSALQPTPCTNSPSPPAGDGLMSSAVQSRNKARRHQAKLSESVQSTYSNRTTSACPM